MNDDPTTWSDLNWVKNHTRYYFSAAQLGHPGMPSNKKRATFEVTDPNNQCKEALSHMSKLSGKPGFHTNLNLQLGITKCYISGFTITDDGGLSMKDQAGYQCEHILTASTIAMLCGLPSKLYAEVCEELLSDLKENSDNSGRYTAFHESYKTYQEELWPLLYDWSMPCPNEYKDNHPFLRVDFKSDGLRVKPLEETVGNIKKLLGILFLKPIDPSKVSKISLFREQVVKKQLTTDLHQHMIDRFTFITRKMMLIKEKLDSYDPILLKHYCYLSTKTMLNVIITKVLSFGPFKWVKPLRKLFKKSGSGLESYMDRVPKTKLSITNFLKFKRRQVGGAPDEIIYYTEENLTNDVILGALLLLKLKERDLFVIMGIDDPSTVGFNIDTIDLGKVIDETEGSEIYKFNQFCDFFRYYINLENTIKYSVQLKDASGRATVGLDDATVNENFRRDVISVTNYIWNVYQSYSDLEEAIVIGTSETVDELSEGPKLDETAAEHIDAIDTIKLLESMGNELSDEILPSTGLAAGQSKRGKRKNKTKRKKKKQKKEILKSPMETISKELGSMKFMIGNKEISF